MAKPTIRFRGFDDEWEQRKFGELGSVAMCKRIFKEQTSPVGDIPFYKIGTFGAEPDAFISRELFEEYKEKFQYPKIGDMLISASGTIGRTVEYDGEEAYFQDSNIVWFKHDERVDNSFLKCIYGIIKWSGIEGSTIKRLYNDNFLKTEFYMPSVAEQEKVGEYFANLDHIITLHQRKCDETKKLKKYMLQKMFPQNGSKVPEIRFKGFTDEWEQRKLGEVLKERSERANGSEELLSVTIGNGVIKQADSDKRNTASDDKSNYKIVRKGDLPYNSMRMWQGAVGNSEYDGIVSPAYTVLVPTEEANSKFFMELFKKESTLQIFQRWSQGLTSDTWNLKYPALSTIQFYIPSVFEQTKIADYFIQLDHLITLHQHKCEELKKLKKFMLQNMFTQKNK